MKVLEVAMEIALPPELLDALFKRYGFRPTREVAMGDKEQGADETKPAAPPTLRLPGEPVPDGGPGKVQFPTSGPAAPIPAPPTTSSTDPSQTPKPFIGPVV